MTGELRLGDAREAPDDHQQSLETREPQLVTVVRRRHERHPDEVTKMEDQEVCSESGDGVRDFTNGRKRPQTDSYPWTRAAAAPEPERGRSAPGRPSHTEL